jgi:hypothetical protein
VRPPGIIIQGAILFEPVNPIMAASIKVYDILLLIAPIMSCKLNTGGLLKVGK